MDCPRQIDLTELTTVAYNDGYHCHGELGLNRKDFNSHTEQVVLKKLGLKLVKQAALEFFDALHREDFYLSAACSLTNGIAWDRFIEHYYKYMTDPATFISGSRDRAINLADGVTASLFLPDKSGCSRMASYDGQYSLATWLRVIITRRYINEQELKWASVGRLDGLPDIEGPDKVKEIETTIRANIYHPLVKDAFQSASRSLSDRERLILLWRYEEGLQLNQIAKAMNVNASTISRQLDRCHQKLREQIISFLGSEYELKPESVKECIADIFENPAYSIISYIRAG